MEATENFPRQLFLFLLDNLAIANPKMSAVLMVSSSQASRRNVTEMPLATSNGLDLLDSTYGLCQQRRSMRKTVDEPALPILRYRRHASVNSFTLPPEQRKGTSLKSAHI